MISEVTSATFDRVVLQADRPVVVDFWAPWCGPCRRLAPVLDDVSRDLGDQILVVKVNTDENPDLPGRYGVMSIPTLIVFKDGAEADRIVGLLSRAELEQRIEEAL